MSYSRIWSKVLREDEEIFFEFSISTLYIIITLLIGFGIIIFLSLFTEHIFYSIGQALGYQESFFIFKSRWIIGIITTISILILVFYCGYYLRVAHAYALTNSRFVVHRGWLWTKAISIEYNDITDVQVVQGFFEKILLQSGTIIINTAGSDSNEVRLDYISHPYEIRKKIDSFRDDLIPEKYKKTDL